MTRWKKLARVGGVLALIVAGLSALYALVVRPWHLHRGATADEAQRTLPGAWFTREPSAP